MIYEKQTYPTCDVLFFNKTNPEWQRVQNLCLKDKQNWLRKNYLPKNLIIEHHDIFYIRYKKDTNIPMQFGGIYNNSRYPYEVARVLNRLYTFREFRNFNKSEFTSTVLQEAEDFFLPTMFELMPVKRKLLFWSMQLRLRNEKTLDARWFNGAKKMWLNNKYNWQLADGLVQVAPGENLECYQLVVYKEFSDYKFTDWSPKTLTREQFKERFSLT